MLSLTGRVVLASGSPRRRAFFEGAGLSIAVRPVDIDERVRAGENSVDFADRMAAEKARAALARGDRGWVIASDTVVTLDGQVLGKPVDSSDAVRILSSLAGREHAVITAWVVASIDGWRAGRSVSRVWFESLSTAEIEAYVATGEPLDKAGGYGIQGQGGALVARVEGSYDGIVGLPFGQVLDALKSVGALESSSVEALRGAAVRGRMAAVLQAAGRPLDSATLVAVCKGHSIEAAQRAVVGGLVELGENYVQPLVTKAEKIGAPAHWHFIGRLQRNKARAIAECPTMSLVHGLDNERVAEALSRRLVAAGRTLQVLAQVSLVGETSKGGVIADDVEAFLDVLSGLPGLEVSGLMTIPPVSGRREARQHFARLRTLRDSLATTERSLPHLSMGMSGDFEQALAEGATLIRVGTAIFGPRG